MDISDVVKIGITALSTIVALWQIRARLNIQKMLQQESFNLHSSVALVLGDCQRTINDILSNQIQNALASAGRAEGGSQMLLKQTVKLICHYHNPTDADVDAWTMRGKISASYKPMFLTHSSKNVGWLRSVYRVTLEKIV